jgi:hypothetical protein
MPTLSVLCDLLGFPISYLHATGLKVPLVAATGAQATVTSMRFNGLPCVLIRIGGLCLPRLQRVEFQLTLDEEVPPQLKLANRKVQTSFYHNLPLTSGGVPH